jgi:hypothetical protein
VGLALGGTMSGATLGLGAALLPATPSTATALLAAGAAIALAVYDLIVSEANLPQRRSLIPQDVFFQSRRLGFVRFGLEFGSGIRTFVTSASPYAVIGLLIGTSESFGQALAMGLAFGVGRAIGPLQALFAHEVHWSADVSRFARLVERLGTCLVAVVAVGTFLVGYL